MKRYYDDLDPALVSAAERARAEGKLDDAALEDFFTRVRPFLDDLQAARLRAMIDKLKTGE